jgi:hypothetical protein
VKIKKFVGCPMCRGKDLGYYNPSCKPDGKMYQVAVCNTCKATWKDVYVYSGSIDVRRNK